MVLIGKPEGKIPLVRPRHRWRVLFKKCIFYKWDEGMDWIGLFQDVDTSRALVNAIMDLLVP